MGPKRKIILIILITLVLLFILMEARHYDVQNPKILRAMILEFGAFAPIAYIILHALQAVFPFVPGNVLSIVSGYLFGPWMGVTYNVIGVMAGTCLTFYLSRKVGSRLLHAFSHKDTIGRVERYFKRKGRSALFLLRIFPVAPNNIVSFYAGLSKVSFIYFFFISVIGFLPYIILFNFFGSELSEGISLKYFILLLIMLCLISVVYYLLYKRGSKDD
jgi:uncharacterized membrane protein YdjX (TVP38/TMEM64 family)